MDNIYDVIKHIIDETIDKYYTKKHKHTIKNRYKGLNEGMIKILKLTDKNYKQQAEKYYQKRTSLDKKLKKIQDNAIKEVNNCMKKTINNIDYEILPASSFSAKTNLIHESDIDFAFLIKNMTKEPIIIAANILGLCGYKFKEIRNIENPKLIHYVFEKYIDNVEIEMKVRDKDGFTELYNIHNYLDNIMDKKTKMLITYLKHLLQKDKVIYAKFKMIYYMHGCYHTKCKDLMYGLL